MRRVLPVLAALLPAAAAAHPHVFVETAMEIVTDGEGRVAGVRMTWTYDEFFTLVLTEDLGLDADGDLQLTPDEEARLSDHVLDWPADFSGDLQVTQGGQALPLGPRTEAGAALRDGRLVETHLRALAEPPPLATSPVLVQNFDPYYYVAYTVNEDVRVAGGAGCAARLIRADLDAAFAEVEDLYSGLDVAGAAPDVQLPPVGASFADTVEVTCPG